jgi:hypothetical protein
MTRDTRNTRMSLADSMTRQGTTGIYMNMAYPPEIYPVSDEKIRRFLSDLEEVTELKYV